MPAVLAERIKRTNSDDKFKFKTRTIVERFDRENPASTDLGQRFVSLGRILTAELET